MAETIPGANNALLRSAVLILAGIETAIFAAVEVFALSQIVSSSEQITRSISVAIAVTVTVPFLLFALPALILGLRNRRLKLALTLAVLVLVAVPVLYYSM